MATIKEVKLPVPYFSQCNNETKYFGSGYRQCFLTSVAMMLEYITKGELSKKAKLNGFAEPESYYSSKLVRFGDTTSSEAHVRCLRADFELKAEFRNNLSKADIIKQLDKGTPTPLGVDFKADGHWVLAVGHNQKGLLLHDPFGVRHGSSNNYDIGANGAYDLYTWDLLNKVLFDLGSSSAWGILIH